MWSSPIPRLNFLHMPEKWEFIFASNTGWWTPVRVLATGICITQRLVRLLDLRQALFLSFPKAGEGWYQFGSHCSHSAMAKASRGLASDVYVSQSLVEASSASESAVCISKRLVKTGSSSASYVCVQQRLVNASGGLASNAQGLVKAW